VTAVAEHASRAVEIVFRRLSSREREVFRLLVLGYTSAEIARFLSISPRTVEGHRLRLQRKLGLSTRAQLVRLALAHGFFDDPLMTAVPVALLRVPAERSSVESAAAAAADGRRDTALREARR
jgi:DNA-binding CsgD family transcriptional regulator